MSADLTEPLMLNDREGSARSTPPQADGAPAADLAAVLRELRVIRDLLSAQTAELLDAAATARFLGISEASLYRARALGRVPQPVRLAGSVAMTRWRRSDLARFIAELKPAK